MLKIRYEFPLIAALIMTFGAGAAFAQDTARPQAVKCDEFDHRTHDDDKARLDNCAIQIQTSPGSQLYIIIYRGLAKSLRWYDGEAYRTRQYLANTRGIDSRRILIVPGAPIGSKSTYRIYIVPPGAEPPPK